jgi:hypothetical protein
MLTKYDLEKTILQILKENSNIWFSKKKIYKMVTNMYIDNKHDLYIGHFFYVWYKITNKMNICKVVCIDDESFIIFVNKNFSSFITPQINIDDIYRNEEFPFIDIDSMLRHMILYPSLYSNYGKDFLLHMMNKRSIEEIIIGSKYKDDFIKLHMTSNSESLNIMMDDMKELEEPEHYTLYSISCFICLGIIALFITANPYSS